MKTESIIRAVLERAIEDGLVAPMETLDDPDPQSRTDEELQGCVRLLEQRLGAKPDALSRRAVPPPHRPLVTKHA